MSKGVWRLNKVISSLLALCAFLVLAKFGDELFIGNEAIGWVLFYGERLLGLLCGIYILLRCTGNIIQLGILFVLYYSINALLNIFVITGIYHDFGMTTYALFDIAIWCIDILWVYGMWWMLTRKPIDIKE